MPLHVFAYENDDEQEVFEFLDDLRESGVTNMFGAAPYIAAEFDVPRSIARTYLTDWMRTFSQRHPE
jgi:hypothetical protein